MGNSIWQLLILFVLGAVIIFQIVVIQKLKKDVNAKVIGDLNVVWYFDEDGTPSSKPLIFATFTDDPEVFKNGDSITLIVRIKNML